ncbi:MAG: pseudouridine synthase [Candidatus Hydrogenedentes bacterium]|nr:pseudouridine synthase [Candidatus Hydrogenedentota bacterium]
MVRLQKYLAECGVASRRESETLILDGRVRVNGVVAAIGQTVEPESDKIEVDGVPVAQQRLVYIVLNKPRGVVTTAKDTHGRKTVLDLVAGAGSRVFPVGRLDMDVDGARLLTNDGDRASRLMHPKLDLEKTDRAWISGAMTPETAARLAKGVDLEDGPTAPAKVNIIQQARDATFIRLTLHEGRKREVKRMCEAVGHPVKTLRRVEFGGINVSGMREGEWRHLSHDEIESLRRHAGL